MEGIYLSDTVAVSKNLQDGGNPLKREKQWWKLMMMMMFCCFFFTVLTSSKPNINFISEIKVMIILCFFRKRKQQISVVYKKTKTDCCLLKQLQPILAETEQCKIITSGFIASCSTPVNITISRTTWMKEYPIYIARFRAVTCFALQNFSQQKKGMQYSNLQSGNNPFNFFQFIVNYINIHFPNSKLNPLNDV